MKKTARKATSPRAGKVSSGRAASSRTAKEQGGRDEAELAAIIGAQSAEFDLLMAKIDAELDLIDSIVGRSPARLS
jgi:hypothetical protein